MSLDCEEQRKGGALLAENRDIILIILNDQQRYAILPNSHRPLIS